MTAITRKWQAAREKVVQEGLCRHCGSRERLEAAHVLGREHDRFTLEGITRRNKTWHVERVRIVPLCGACHILYDAKALDLLPSLRADEQAQAVLDAGSIESARKRMIGGGGER